MLFDHTTRSNTPQLCECGCGQPAPVATYTNRKQGYVRGQPVRFISGHNTRRRLSIEPPNPSGLCMCGCGQRAPIAPHTDTTQGIIKGEPMRFIHGHNARRFKAERFWSMVERRSKDECWLWRGADDGRGYGVMTVEGRTRRASRVSWELHRDAIPDGLSVCHTCDNPSCVNPAHLFLGMPRDNSQDMVQKERNRRGDQKPNAKLTKIDVLAIRRMVRAGRLHKDVAARYDVSKSLIGAIMRKVIWAWVPDGEGDENL